MSKPWILAIGALLIVLACLLVGTAPNYSNPSMWLQDWQTLIAGLFALGAAVSTIEWMRKGIEETRKQADERRSGDLAAARAVLPLALSAVCSYAQKCGKVLNATLGHPEPQSDNELVKLPENFAVPDPPDSAIVAFRDCIRSASPPHSEELEDLISQIQVQHARLTGLPEEVHSGKVFAANVVQYILDVADIYARASALFVFARRGDKEIPPLPHEIMHSALNQLGFHTGDFGVLDERVERRRKRLQRETPSAREARE